MVLKILSTGFTFYVASSKKVFQLKAFCFRYFSIATYSLPALSTSIIHSRMPVDYFFQYPIFGGKLLIFFD